MNASLLPTIRSASLPVPLLYSANVPHQETMLFNEFKVPEQAIALQVPQQPAVSNCHTFVPPSLQPVLAELQSKDAVIRALNSELNDQHSAIITLNSAQEVLKTGKESNEEEIQALKMEKKDMEWEVGQIRQSNKEHRAELAKQKTDFRVKEAELLQLRGVNEERIRHLDEQIWLLKNQRNEDMLALKAEIKKLEMEMEELKRLNRELELSRPSKEKIEMSEKKIEELKVDIQVLKEESQRLERKCNTLELEVEGFREWKPKRDMELDTLQKDVKIFDAEKKSLIIRCDEIKMREHSLLAQVRGLMDTKQKLNDSEAEQAREMEVHRREILHLKSEICGFKNDREEYRGIAERFQREKGELENEISMLKSKIKNIKAECDTDDEENPRPAKRSRTPESVKRSGIPQGPEAIGYVSPGTPREFPISSSVDGRQAQRIGSEVRTVNGHQQNLY